MIAQQYPNPLPEADLCEPAILARIFEILKASHGVDFALYRQTTIERRLALQMSRRRVPTVREYFAALVRSEEERQGLFEALLVPTTGFFREPLALRILGRRVRAQLIASDELESVRVWVAGCSSGQEVYSIGIILLEAMERAKIKRPFQIFGTDTNSRSAAIAREGFYPAAVRANVSVRRLRHFFFSEPSGYRVAPILREHCIFARQTLGSDPPLANMDVVSCQNVLIYVNALFRRKIIRELHFALKPGGLLLLGPAESADAPELFERASKRCKLYRRLEPG